MRISLNEDDKPVTIQLPCGRSIVLHPNGNVDVVPGERADGYYFRTTVSRVIVTGEAYREESQTGARTQTVTP